MRNIIDSKYYNFIFHKVNQHTIFESEVRRMFPDLSLLSLFNNIEHTLSKCCKIWILNRPKIIQFCLSHFDIFISFERINDLVNQWKPIGARCFETN